MSIRYTTLPPRAITIMLPTPASVVAQRLLLLLSALLAFSMLRAQTVLFVDDNNNITDNSVTMMATLDALSLEYTMYNVENAGIPPTLDQMTAHDAVIWYCSTDGVGLGFWDPAAQSVLSEYALAGGKLWIIGADILYANGYTAPHNFTAGDLASDIMGLDSYDAQSFGDDGGAGVALLEVAPAAAAFFNDQVQWIFDTAWWVDGVTPQEGISIIYTMGPQGYALAGSPVMVHNHQQGFNVLSTFFDPALIDTETNRMIFVAASLFWMESGMSVDENAPTTTALRFGPNPTNGDVTMFADLQLAQVQLIDQHGRFVLDLPMNANRVVLPTLDLAPGVYTVRGSTPDGRILSGKLVRY